MSKVSWLGTHTPFQPDPRNIFHLTSTLAKLEPELRKRVYVFPVALGSAPGESKIYAAADNKGNAVVGQEIKDKGHPNQTFLEPLKIPVERLDDLLDTTSHYPHLVKMDAQGYECYILEGAPHFLQSTRAIYFKFEPIMLRAFENCSEEILWEKFRGFKIFNDLKLQSALPSGMARVWNMPKLAEAINVVAFHHH